MVEVGSKRAFPPWALIAVYLYMCVLWTPQCHTRFDLQSPFELYVQGAPRLTRVRNSSISLPSITKTLSPTRSKPLPALEMYCRLPSLVTAPSGSRHSLPTRKQIAGNFVPGFVWLTSGGILTANKYIEMIDTKAEPRSDPIHSSQ